MNMLKVKLMNLFDMYISIHVWISYSMFSNSSIRCINTTSPSPELVFSLSPTIFNSVARIQHTNLVGALSFSPSLSLCVCAWGGLSSSHAYILHL